MSRQALVKHLAHLSEAGLVDPVRQGREVRYQLVPDRLRRAAGWMEQVGALWDQRLDALARQLGEKPG